MVSILLLYGTKKISDTDDTFINSTTRSFLCLFSVFIKRLQTAGDRICDRTQRKKPWELEFPGFFKEAQTGFEPVNQGVADPRLTTWLLRRNEIIELLSYCPAEP